MAKLCQIIAVANGKKSKVQSGITKLYHILQKGALFTGLSRTYTPKDEDGEELPSESARIQQHVRQVLLEACQLWGDMFDVVATLDYGNCNAKADIVVDGNEILKGVPVTHLLFIEKKLNDIGSFVNEIPTLDPTQSWDWSDNAGCYESEPVDRSRTKKVPKSHVLYEATKEHPAQVEMFTEDVLVGTWRHVDYSGAIPLIEKQRLQNKVDKLRDAVKVARESANGVEVDKVKTGDSVLGYIFGDTAS